MRPNRQPRLLTPEMCQIVTQLVSNAFKRRAPISMVYVIQQIQLFFEIAVSLDTTPHILKLML
jgi:hypothetical protein